MAMDTRQKRAAAAGAGRIWYRNTHPSNVDAAQRASMGLAYPVAAFASPSGLTVINFGRGLMRSMFRGLER